MLFAWLRYTSGIGEFIARRVAQQMDYRWNVEQDAMAWETAVGGIATMEQRNKS